MSESRIPVAWRTLVVARIAVAIRNALGSRDPDDPLQPPGLVSRLTVMQTMWAGVHPELVEEGFIRGTDAGYLECRSGVGARQFFGLTPKGERALATDGWGPDARLSGVQAAAQKVADLRRALTMFIAQEHGEMRVRVETKPDFSDATLTVGESGADTKGREVYLRHLFERYRMALRRLVDGDGTCPDPSVLRALSEIPIPDSLSAHTPSAPPPPPTQ
jgi:hypothetical protein